MKVRLLIPVYLAIALLVVFSCSRKADDELPARSGDLKVLVRIADEFGVLDDTINIPVLVSLFVDSAHTRLVRSEAVIVKNHTTKEVLFEDLEPIFFSLNILINKVGLPETCPDGRVFVQENQLTTTTVFELEVRSEEIRCNY